jgi:hypothetical protein
VVENQVCKSWAKQANSEILWKSLIERHYGPHCLVPCDSWKGLYKRIGSLYIFALRVSPILDMPNRRSTFLMFHDSVNTGFSIFHFGLVHFDPQNPQHGPYWRKEQSTASKFGCIARLNNGMLNYLSTCMNSHTYEDPCSVLARIWRSAAPRKDIHGMLRCTVANASASSRCIKF